MAATLKQPIQLYKTMSQLNLNLVSELRLLFSSLLPQIAATLLRNCFNQQPFFLLSSRSSSIIFASSSFSSANISHLLPLLLLISIHEIKNCNFSSLTTWTIKNFNSLLVLHQLFNLLSPLWRNQLCMGHRLLPPLFLFLTHTR